VAQSIFALMMTAPYNLGVTTQLLNEVDFNMNTGSWRSVYTGTGRTAEEIMMDEIAAALRRDPVQFRLDTLKEERANSDYKYARQANWPADVRLHVFPGQDGNEPGGAGETSVAAAAGAVANAYARATRTKPRNFPINH